MTLTPYTQKMSYPKLSVPVCSVRYSELDIQEPNYDDVLPWHLCEDQTRLIVGNQFTLNGKRIAVEAQYDDHKGYALRNIHGEKIKWVDRYTLCEAIAKSDDFYVHKSE